MLFLSTLAARLKPGIDGLLAFLLTLLSRRGEDARLLALLRSLEQLIQDWRNGTLPALPEVAPPAPRPRQTTPRPARAKAAPRRRRPAIRRTSPTPRPAKRAPFPRGAVIVPRPHSAAPAPNHRVRRKIGL